MVCGKCSSHTAKLEYDKSKPLRVCDECFVLLQDEGAAREGTPSSDSGDGTPTTGSVKVGDFVHTVLVTHKYIECSSNMHTPALLCQSS